MRLFTKKTLPWIIGIAAMLALGGLIPGILLNTPDSPIDAPAVVKSVAPALPDSNVATPASAVPASVVVDSFSPPTSLLPDLSVAAGIVGSDPITGVSNTSIPQRVSGQASPVEISIAPVEDWNPIRTQHTFTIKVNEEGGAPAGGVEVELILNRFGEAVGDIVSIAGDNPRKVDNTFGRVITDANGEATLTITATRAGDTDVTAYAPQIADADVHKVFAVKHWVDMQVEFPGDAVNLVGTDHPMQVRVFRVTDDVPLSDVQVLWSIQDDDPDGSLNNTDNVASTRTNADGVAEAILRQVSPATGDNTVSIQVIHDSGDTMFSQTITKEWRAPSLEVTKDGPASLGLRKTEEYVVNVTNTGNSVASGVTLSDDLPPGLSFVSSSPEATSVESSSVTWDLGDIEPDGSVTITMVLSASAIGTQVNQATAVSTEGFTGQDDSTTNVIPGSLALTKSAPEQVNLGDAITYDITVTNDGEGSLTNVAVTDTLPEGVALVSASPAASSGAAVPVQWTIGQLDSGVSQTFQISATAQALGSHTNTVAASSDEGASASAEATTQVIASDVSVTKTVDNETIVVGEQATFTVTVTNNGDGDATGVSVADILPEGLELVSTEPAAAEGGSPTWTIESLGAGESAILTLVTTATTSGSHTNVVEVTDRGISVGAQATVVAQTPAISLTKTGGSAMYIDGERDYVITAVNSGEADLTGVTITDTFPGTLSYVSSDNEGVATGNTVTWNIGDLAVGESMVVSVRLKGEAAGDVTNEASVTSDQGAEAEASFDISILAAAGAHLQIIDSIDPMGVGDQGEYTITVRNQSANTAITNVQVAVVIPTELEILSAEGGSISDTRVTYAAIESLGAGQELEFTITVRASQAGDVVVSATMSYAEFNQSITAQEGTTVISR